jgi:hypothetical protein
MKNTCAESTVPWTTNPVSPRCTSTQTSQSLASVGGFSPQDHLEEEGAARNLTTVLVGGAVHPSIDDERQRRVVIQRRSDIDVEEATLGAKRRRRWKGALLGAFYRMGVVSRGIGREVNGGGQWWT